MAAVSSTSPTSLETQPGQRKSVRFAETTKDHDGLCTYSRLFYEFILGALGMSEKCVVSNLKQSLDVRGLIKVHNKLIDLIRRCSLSINYSVPVLKDGGSNMMITKDHLPYLYEHVVYQNKLIGKIKRRLKRAKKKKKRSKK